MIIRLMGEGQYRVDDSLLDELNELDDRATAAAEGDDETTLDQALVEMFELVKAKGERLADEDLSPSDALIPPSDLTLEETRQLLSHEGFIPDLPEPS
jgi:PspA-Associated protein